MTTIAHNLLLVQEPNFRLNLGVVLSNAGGNSVEKDVPSDGRREALTRRGLLTGGGLAVAAAAAALGPADPVSAVERPGYDAIVVGAGFAGSIATRELRARGLKTLLLEARGRAGGRTWTDTFAGQLVEMGGQYVDASQPLVTAELRRYNLGTVAGLAPAKAIMPTPEGPAPFSIEELVTRQGGLLERLFEGSERYFPVPNDPVHRRDLVSRIDRLSLRDRLNQLALSPADESWVSGLTSGQSGGSSTFGALTSLAQWWSLAGWSTEAWYRAQSQRVAAGMAKLVAAILAEAQAEVQFDAPVSTVVDTGRKVVVTTKAGRSYTARTVVVAVPVNLWRTLRFSPGLPPVHATAARQGVGVRHTRKLWLHVHGLSEPVVANGAEGDTFMTVLSHSDAGDGGQLMLALNSLPALDVTSRGAVESAVRRMLPEARVVAHRAQDWGADPYSLGGWALRRPGQLTAQLPWIQQPHGRIAFATSDIASGWAGFVEGAIESGMRSAAQAVNLAR